MFVRDVMTGDVVTVATDATLRAAVGRLLGRDVGSVVAVDDGSPAGLVTRTDALRAAHRTGRPLEGLRVGDVATGPALTVGPGDTVQGTARRLTEAGAKRALVVEDLDVVGVVTMTDIVWNLPEIRAEAQSAEAARRGWE